jgi:hypothetical protein
MTGLLRGKLKAFLLIGTMFALMAAIACQGDQGQAGPVGSVGSAGPAGADGADGADGSDGADGKDGSKGSPGSAGSAGAAGADGEDGAAGAAGAAGARGATGSSGSNGSDGADGTTQIAGIVVFDASGPSTGAAEITAGSASITVIGGGFAANESISISAMVGGSDFLLGDAVANSNGAFTVTADVEAGDGFSAGGIFTITATGDDGNRGASAFMVVDKVAG